MLTCWNKLMSNNLFKRSTRWEGDKNLNESRKRTWDSAKSWRIKDSKNMLSKDYFVKLSFHCLFTAVQYSSHGVLQGTILNPLWCLCKGKVFHLTSNAVCLAFQVIVEDSQLSHLTRDRVKIPHNRRLPTRGHLLAVVSVILLLCGKPVLSVRYFTWQMF